MVNVVNFIINNHLIRCTQPADKPRITGRKWKFMLVAHNPALSSCPSFNRGSSEINVEKAPFPSKYHDPYLRSAEINFINI
ncbi:hypothetical protein SAMN05518856_12084 [Paenibacillus sp. OK003]|nr:hypothetical protein SAMN05518856_12084 [Paenibacillus sp. OK003]